MNEIRLTGRLVCESSEELALVTALLQEHISLTRAEPGCLSFDVVRVSDSMVWRVEERFIDEAAYRFHQERSSKSEWGRLTLGIARDYSVQGLTR